MPLIRLNVELDRRTMNRLRRELRSIPGGFRRAQVTAINETGGTGRTRVSSEVRKYTTLRKRHVDEKISLKKATRGQLIPSATLKIRDTQYGLSKFNILPNRPVSQRGVPVAKRKPRIGVGIKVWKALPRRPLKRSWVYRGSRDLHVLRRPSRAARDEPRISYGPSIGDILRKKTGLTVLEVQLADVLLKNLNRQVRRLLAGR